MRHCLNRDMAHFVMNSMGDKNYAIYCYRRRNEIL